MAKQPFPSEKTTSISRTPVVNKMLKTPPAKVSEPAEDPAQPEKKGSPIGARKYKDDDVITLLVNYNPKRPNSKAHASFSCYVDGGTVKEFLDAGGLSISLPWDVKHGFIEIGPEHNAEAEVKSRPVKEVKAKPEKPAKPAKEEPKSAIATVKGKKAAPPVEEEEEAEEDND